MTFNKDSVTLDDGELSLTYLSCSPNLIITPPNKELEIKQVDCRFSLTTAVLSKLIKVATMNQLPNLSVWGKDGALFLKIHEKANDTSNSGLVNIGEYFGDEFIASFKTEHLKLLPADYDVELQKGAFAKFVSKDGNLKYFVSQEAK